LSRTEIGEALARAAVRVLCARESGRVAVLDLSRARRRPCEIVFVLGLEEGSLPRRSSASPASPFLDEDARRELDARTRRARLARPDPLARERYLFYTACTRASRRLYLVREAATDDGAPRAASPFWDHVRALYSPEEVTRWTRRRSLATLVWPLEEAPSERERLRAVAALTVSDRESASALAIANGWERRLERAQSALDRPTRLTHPAVLEELRTRATFGVTELEAFAAGSSLWLVGRPAEPRSVVG